VDYFDFVDGLFSDRPSVMALRFSLVKLGEEGRGESNTLWFVRDAAAAICAAGSLASTVKGRPFQLAQDYADDQAVSGLKLPGHNSGVTEILQVERCGAETTERLRSCFVPDGPYLVAADLEESLAAGEGAGEAGDGQSTVRVVFAGLPLGSTFEKSVWLLALCGDTVDALDEETLFRCLASCYPIRFHRTPYHRWNRELGDQYWSGLPWLQKRFLGSLEPGAPRTGDPLQNLFWSKNRNSLLPAWKGVCDRGIHDLLREIRRRLTDLDDRSADRIHAQKLIQWIEDRGARAGVCEADCALVLCAGSALAKIDRLWLPLLCLLWRRDALEKAKDLDSALAEVLGQGHADLWRKYAEVGHAGYAIQATIELREALARVRGGLVSESIQYRAPQSEIIETIEIAGIEQAVAKTLVGDIVNIDAQASEPRGAFMTSRGSHSPLSADLRRALRNLKDKKRGGIEGITAEYVPVRAALRVQIPFRIGSVR